MAYQPSTISYPAGSVFANRPRLALLFWIGAAGFVALLQAYASTISWKIGLAAVIALFFSMVLIARPALLLPLAGTTVVLEAVTLSGMPVTRLLAPGAAIVVIAEFVRGGGRVRPSPPLFFATLYISWAILSGLWSDGPEGTRFLLQSLGIALVYTFAFAILLNSERDLKTFLYPVVLVASIIAGLSVIAFGTPGLKIPYLELLQAGRAQGAVGDPDFFAAMSLVFIPLGVVLASESRQRWLRFLMVGATVTLLAGTFLSLSRGAFLATMVLGIMFLATRPERLFRARQEKAAALIIIAIGLIGFFSRPFLREEVVTRAESIYAPKTQEEASGAGRTELWKGAIRTAQENPILGVGFGSFPIISQELILHTPGVNPLVFQKRKQGDNFVAHNTYLGTAAELGFTGLFLYLALLVSTGLTLRKISKQALRAGAPFVGRVAFALFLGLTAWALCTFFLNGETARTFWIIIGITLALPKLIPDPVPERAGNGYRTPSNAPRS
jgi:O-antigen ligase